MKIKLDYTKVWGTWYEGLEDEEGYIEVYKFNGIYKTNWMGYIILERWILEWLK